MSMCFLREASWGAMMVCMTVLVVPATGLAEEHALVVEARRAADRAEFERARALLEDLPEDLGLSQSDLRSALILRASLAFALEDSEAMDRDLALVARFTAPDEVPEDLPPALRDRIAAHRATAAPIVIEADARSSAEGVIISLRHSEEDLLVRRVRLFTRIGDDLSWVEPPLSGSEHEVVGAAPVDFYAIVVGLGGAVLAAAGSREEPRHVDPAEMPEAGSAGAAPGGLPLWPFVVGAVVVAAALAIGLGVGLSADGNDHISVGRPVVSW